MLEITSARNPRVTWLRSLRVRKYREREGRFVVEGIRIVEAALASGRQVETLVYSPSLLVSERARRLVDSCPPHVERLAVSPQVFGALSGREEPQGIAAVVRAEELGLSAISPREDLLMVIAHQLRDPGNLGSVIRTADAVGATCVVVVEPSVDVYDPLTVRATMGSLFAIPVLRLADDGAVQDWGARVRASGLPLELVASSAHGDRDCYDVDLRGPLVLVLGSERDGLPEAWRRWADVVVRLPMKGSATSLNVSAAAAALLYEVVRQRRTADSAGRTPGPR